MRDRHLEHDAVPVHLTEGWVGICATCGWVGESQSSKELAEKDASQHVLQQRQVKPPLPRSETPAMDSREDAE